MGIKLSTMQVCASIFSASYAPYDTSDSFYNPENLNGVDKISHSLNSAPDETATQQPEGPTAPAQDASSTKQLDEFGQEVSLSSLAPTQASDATGPAEIIQEVITTDVRQQNEQELDSSSVNDPISSLEENIEQAAAQRRRLLRTGEQLSQPMSGSMHKSPAIMHD